MKHKFNLLRGDEPLCLFLNEGIAASKQMFAYSRPKSFADTQDSERNEMFVSALLFHEYASGIIYFLRNVLDVLEDYSTITDKFYRSFAEEQRAKAIQQGIILPADLDEGGNIITENIPNRVLEPYVVRHYLCPPDTSEIILNINPFDIRKYFNLLISFTERNLARSGKDKYGIKNLEKDRNGNMVKISDDEVSIRNATKAADLYLYRGKFITIAIVVNSLISKINNLPPFKDNKEEISDIEKTVQKVLDMKEPLDLNRISDKINEFTDSVIDKPIEKSNSKNKTEE